MSLLLVRGLASIVGEKDPVDILQGVLSAADIGTNVKARITVSAVLPVDQIDLLFVDQEVVIAGIPVDVYFLMPSVFASSAS